MRKLISFALLLCICVAVLHFGGYSFDSFKSKVHLRNPNNVLSPILPDNLGSNNSNNGNSSNGYTFDPNASLDINANSSSNADIPNTSNSTLEIQDSSSNIENSSISNEETTNIENSELITSNNNQITTYNFNNNSDKFINLIIDGTEKVVTPDNTADFLNWLHNNFTDNSDVKIEDNTIENSTISELLNNDYTSLANSIMIIDSLPTYTDYDRTLFEKPVKSYELNGDTVNRNDYAWKTSPYFNAENFTYTCPYTGKVITDLDDKKEDKDFANMDFDHIVPLKSAYLRGAKDWTPEQKNAYAYDQSIGVDVLNSANRSKSDKGPAEWLPDINRGSYCYSWLVICEKYNLAMTNEEIKICNDEINKAIKNGEQIEFMGGNYND